MEKYNKINDQCLSHIQGMREALAIIETKGDSTMIMYKIRLTLDAVLEQIRKDNEKSEEDKQEDKQEK